MLLLEPTMPTSAMNGHCTDTTLLLLLVVVVVVVVALTREPQARASRYWLAAE